MPSIDINNSNDEFVVAQDVTIFNREIVKEGQIVKAEPEDIKQNCNLGCQAWEGILSLAAYGVVGTVATWFFLNSNGDSGF